MAVTALLTTTSTFALQISMSSLSQESSRRVFMSKTAPAIIGGAAFLTSHPTISLAEGDSSDPYADYITTESGLRYKVTKEGTGAVPQPGQNVKTQYTGWLDGFDSIRKFDSSRDRGRPFSFRVGAGQVIRGWDEAFGSMAVGERRNIIIPPRLGYGDRGAGGVIPGGATLYFDVELLAIQ
eukprot:CAMPEP_0172497254 /NCGR_PEP_ID=MMETSP1066-20121228/97237_1 /TAXON_ID=671091 /ORGANISM="Coscinodiscus wailesii, Strain CCMP2513" /LENGTH=180 /DNA_ID=CAMNT_0013269909 /DNA_START=107 /DNA_END=649 /DNA_ORIENTATION=+